MTSEQQKPNTYRYQVEPRDHSIREESLLQSQEETNLTMSDLVFKTGSRVKKNFDADGPRLQNNTVSSLVLQPSEVEEASQTPHRNKMAVLPVPEPGGPVGPTGSTSQEPGAGASGSPGVSGPATDPGKYELTSESPLVSLTTRSFAL